MVSVKNQTVIWKHSQGNLFKQKMENTGEKLRDTHIKAEGTIYGQQTFQTKEERKQRGGNKGIIENFHELKKTIPGIKTTNQLSSHKNNNKLRYLLVK